MLTPIFYQHEWVGFAANMAHKSGIGGTVPGSGSGNAREIYQEGLHLPPVKFMSRLQPVKEIDAVITANSRTPALVIGDLRGQVGAARLGERRFAELMDRYGEAPVLESTELLSAYTESRVRQAIASWPDGESEGESFVDHDGIDLTRRIRIHVKVKKLGDKLHFDFSACSDQTQGPANIRPPLVRAACAYCLVALVDRFLPINQGLARTIDATFRQGSVVDPRFPAAVNTYMPTALTVAEAVLRALARFVPEKRISGGSGSAALVCKTAPIEIIESEFPARVERFEMIPDSGGAGEWRGGLGFARDYRILADDVRFSMRTDKHSVEPFGTDHGLPGGKGACIVNPKTKDEKTLPSRFGDHRLNLNDIVRVERPGGGGLGNALARPVESVLEDMRQGYVSVERARSDYGVAVRDTDGELKVDVAETQVLRGKK